MYTNHQCRTPLSTCLHTKRYKRGHAWYELMYLQCLLRLMHKTGGRSRSWSFPFPLPLPTKPSLGFDADFFVFFFFFFLAAEGASIVFASTGSASGPSPGQAGDVDREV